MRFRGGRLPLPFRQEFETVFASIIAEPVSAMARPREISAAVVSVTPVSATMVPMKPVPVPRVAELPNSQHMLSFVPPSIAVTVELLAVARVGPVWNTNDALKRPSTLSTIPPVNSRDDENV